MTRKLERRRRFLESALILACGVLLAQTASPATHGPVMAAAILAVAVTLGHRRMIASAGVPILTYHSVSPDPGWLPWASEIAVHPETFERHLATLRAMGCVVIGTRALCTLRLAGQPVPRDAVVLHFDDGYLDNWLHALPALARHGFPATFFASLDFIEPGATPRAPDADPAGYMNWAELAAIERNPLFEVEPHGVDHARVPISGRIVDRLTATNWREFAWMQWAAMPGPKHDWFREATPSAVPLGAGVRESGLALASRRWEGAGRESAEALEARIERDLALCVERFRDRLGRDPEIFCWPENAAVPAGRRIAAALGYRATTAGCGRNARAEPAATLSRLHVGDRSFGFRWLPAEALMLRATVRLAQGNIYWYPLVAAAHVMRRVILLARRTMSRSEDRGILSRVAPRPSS